MHQATMQRFSFLALVHILLGVKRVRKTPEVLELYGIRNKSKTKAYSRIRVLDTAGSYKTQEKCRAETKQ